MDEFDDVFTQTAPTSQPATTNISDDNLFGSDDLNNTTTTTTTTDTPSNYQQEDPSWVIENNLKDTTPSQSNILGDDNFDSLTSAPQATPTNDADDLFAGSSDNNELDSYSTTNLSSTADNKLYNDSVKQQEDSSSFDMFSNSISSTPISTNQISSFGMSSTENQSPLQAFNTRRQQEIVDKDAAEKQKIEQLRQQAKQDLERWYQDRRTQMEYKRQTIKNEEDAFRSKALEQSDNKSCDWGKVVRFLEFSPGAQLSKGKRDLNRMKSIILQSTRDKTKRASENGM